jgi:integrase
VILPRYDKERAEQLRKISGKLTHHANMLREVVSELTHSGKKFDVKEIYRSYLLYDSEHSIRGYTRRMTEEMDRNGQSRSAYAYRGVAQAFMNFCGGDLLLDSIDPSLICSFENSIKQRGCRPNTISHYMRILRVICNRACSEGLMKHSTSEMFRQVFTGYAQTPKRALSEGDLSRLLAVNLPSMMSVEPYGSRRYRQLQGMYMAWRLFFFAFHACGMCFVDMARLRKDNIKGDIISYRRKKTRRLIEISVTPSIQLIIDSFADDTKDSPYVFPMLCDEGAPIRRQYETSERIYNRRLKSLEQMAGLERHLSGHTARHTWASMGKNKLFPVGVLSACLGHASEKTTRIYLASFNHEVLAEANRSITQKYHPDRNDNAWVKKV